MTQTVSLGRVSGPFYAPINKQGRPTGRASIEG
jgi:hypothetical protein